MKRQIVTAFSFLLLCNLQVVYGALARENAPVTDPALVKQGYACQSKNSAIGLMKDAEVNANYSPTICGRATCDKGLITYESCSPFSVPGKVIPEDPTKPFPECCPHPA